MAIQPSPFVASSLHEADSLRPARGNQPRLRTGGDCGVAGGFGAHRWNGVLCSAGAVAVASLRRRTRNSTRHGRCNSTVGLSAVKVDADTWFARLCDSARSQQGGSSSSGPRLEFGSRLAETGLAALDAAAAPARNQEAWRYTDLQALLYADPLEGRAVAHNVPVGGAELDALVAALLEDVPEQASSDAAPAPEPGPRLVFVDGELSETLSRLSEGSRTFVGGGHAFRKAAAGASASGAALDLGSRTPQLLGGLPEVDSFPRFEHARDELGCAKLAALNQMLFKDCACLSLAEAEDRVATDKVEVVFVTTGRTAAAGADGAVAGCCAPRLLVDVGRGRSLHLVESHVSLDSSDASLSNGVCRVLVGEGARVRHELLQQKADDARHVESLSAEVAAGASYDLCVVQSGARASRLNVGIALAGESSTCVLTGVMLAESMQQLDLHSLIHHTVPSCRSSQQHKNVVADSAECIFKGTIRVEKEAQKTDSNQLVRTLLLTKKARVKAMPSLQIRADDVSCAHGAAVTELDKEQVFYFMSRGLSEAEAKKLLLVAFPQDLLGGLGQTAPKAYRRVLDKLVHIAQGKI